jgi:hypothetical protein
LVLQMTVTEFPETVASVFLRAKKMLLWPGIQYTIYLLNSFNHGKKLTSRQDSNPKMVTNSSPSSKFAAFPRRCFLFATSKQFFWVENIEFQQDVANSSPKRRFCSPLTPLHSLSSGSRAVPDLTLQVW